jgi:hypothetical protein
MAYAWKRSMHLIPKEVGVNRSLMAAAAAVATFAVIGSFDAMAATFSRKVTLKAGASTRSIALPSVSKPTVYSVTVTGPKAVKVTADLRGKNRSIAYPGIVTTTKGTKRIRIYTYRPLAAGSYRVVLAKQAGPSGRVTLKVTSKLPERGGGG